MVRDTLFSSKRRFSRRTRATPTTALIVHSYWSPGLFPENSAPSGHSVRRFCSSSPRNCRSYRSGSSRLSGPKFWQRLLPWMPWICNRSNQQPEFYLGSQSNHAILVAYLRRVQASLALGLHPVFRPPRWGLGDRLKFESHKHVGSHCRK